MSTKTPDQIMEHITEILTNTKESCPPDFIVNDDITEYENEKIRKMVQDLGYKYRVHQNATHLKNNV